MLTIRFDGASRGNPGKASSAAAAWNGAGRIVGRAYKVHPKPVTCNVAEYLGIIAGLRLALQHGAKTVIVEGDSKLVIEQVFGKWECRHPHLRALHQTVRRLVGLFDAVDGRWIPRERNGDADTLCNHALDAGASEGAELFEVDELAAAAPRPLPVRPSVFIRECAHRKRPYTKKTAPSILEQFGMTD
jgi:ribonuclease HI